MKYIIITIISALLSTPLASLAYTVCQCPPDQKPYVECSGKCPASCTFVSASPGEHWSCQKQKDKDASKADCGLHWSDYKTIGEGRENPCPNGCERGDAVEYRGSIQRFPPVPVFSEKFQCYGIPIKRVKCPDAWTDWYTSGGGVGNPCAKVGCSIRGREVGKDHRVVDFVHPQDKTKFECWKEVSD